MSCFRCGSKVCAGVRWLFFVCVCVLGPIEDIRFRVFMPLFCVLWRRVGILVVSNGERGTEKRCENVLKNRRQLYSSYSAWALLENIWPMAWIFDGLDAHPVSSCFERCLFYLTVTSCGLLSGSTLLALKVSLRRPCRFLHG